MKQYFFYAIATMVPLAILGWFLVALGRSLWTLFEDWRLGKELDELQAEGEARRQRRQQQNAERLANGCDHDFDQHSFGFPPDSCSKCGLEREKPRGACDHVWRLGTGPVPHSSCEKCGKNYDAAGQQSSLG